MFGRVFPLNSKGMSRFIVNGGPGLSVLMDPSNRLQEEIEGVSTMSDYQKTKVLSLMLNTKVEFPVTDIIGVSAGPTLIANKEKISLGLCVGFMFGFIKSSQYN